MIRIKDLDGNIVHGLLRDDLGQILVDDKEGYDRHKMIVGIRERDKEKIHHLESELSELKYLVNQLLNK